MMTTARMNATTDANAGRRRPTPEDVTSRGAAAVIGFLVGQDLRVARMKLSATLTRASSAKETMTAMVLYVTLLPMCVLSVSRTATA
jgi:hypothetical protein